MAFAGLLVGLAGFGLASRLLFDRAASGSPSLARLAEAAGEYRVITPRLTGGFRHARCLPQDAGDPLIAGLVCRPSLEGGAPAPLLRFAAQFRKGRSEDTTSERRHTSGVFGLLWPAVEGSVEQAVVALEDAVAEEPNNARRLSDLAAALLVRADISGNPGDLVDALGALDRAVGLDSALREARFNRALALEFLYLPDQAAAAWEAYLRIDQRSAWATEATARAAGLRRSLPGGAWEEQRALLERSSFRGDSLTLRGIVRVWPQEVREYAFQQLFARWAETAPADQDLDRDSLLAGLRTISRVILAVAGDGLAVDAAAAVEEAKSGGDVGRLTAIREGLVSLRRGAELYERSDPGLASQDLARAERLLARGRMPLREWAAYSLVRALYQIAAYDVALRYAAGIHERVESKRYPVVWGLTAHMQALIHEVRGQHAAAYRARRAALDALVRTGDAGIVARQHTALAELSATLYGEDVASRHLYQAVQLTPAITNRVQRFAILNQVVRHFAGPAPALALLYQGEALGVADSLGDPLRSLYALRARAELEARTGDVARAAHDLQRAERYLDRVPDLRTRAWAHADLQLTAAEIQVRSEPAAALRALNEAIPVFRAVANQSLLPFAHVAVARSHLALGALEPARFAFDSAIAEVERQRSLIDDPSARAQFLDRARPVFDEIVAAEAERGRLEAAFDYFERTRARTLLEEVAARSDGGRPARSLTSAEIRRLLPKDVLILTYAVLEDRLLIWAMQRDRLRLVTRHVSSTHLRDFAEQLRSAILDPQGDVRLLAVAGRLYQELVAPIGAELQSGVRLIIVPDKWLHAVPFAALWDARASRFLVEDHTLGVATSASLYVARAHRPPALTAERGARALVMGNPAFDRRMLLLEDLPHAESEARRVADLYPGATLLVGTQATKRAFLSEAPRYDVIHFAGHAVARPDAPSLSHLVLAGDPGSGDPGTLYAQELYRLALSRTALVVLSGCRTAGGRLSATEGASSLARAFLAAGVGTVVASLWEVEDESTGEFFATYHRLLSRDGDPITALRSAQLEFIRGNAGVGRARTWAAFQAVGGV